MNPIDQLRFDVSDRINDVEVSLSNVPLALLGEFQRDVSDFLKGSSRDVDPTKILVSIEEGSLGLVVSGLLAASTLWADIEHLKSTDSLSLIDPTRAKVVERWQTQAQRNPNRNYLVADQSKKVFFSVNAATNFRRTEDVWVHVEKYLQGNLFEFGGNTKANVHLKLENGMILPPVASNHEFLIKNSPYHLYCPYLLHVTAEENLNTGELRNLHLLALEKHEPSYDEDEFNLMVEKGTKAWAGVQDVNAWLEDIRGN
jgi:hypothetical protein